MEVQQKIEIELLYSHCGVFEQRTSQRFSSLETLSLKHLQKALQISELHLKHAAFLCTQLSENDVRFTLVYKNGI